jgi:hypothetical protein
MKILLHKSDSELLGIPVINIDISNPGENDGLNQLEHQIKTKYKKAYAFCEVDATDIKTLHFFEKGGYQFSEFRIKSILQTESTEIGTQAFYPFNVEIINDENHFSEAIKMLELLNPDDRFSNDPFITADFSKKRILNNLRKSFNSWPDEFLLGLFNQQTDELLGFRSGAFTNKTTAHFYQYAVKNTKSANHTTEILDSLVIAYLKQKGIQHIYAVSTGFNIEELNRLILNHNFKIASSKLLLRKIIGD